MDLATLFKCFPDQASCIRHLERIRWSNKPPTCLQCGSLRIKRKRETGEGKIGRWHCKDCKASFKITQGTLFQGTHIPLQKWFAAIALMLNAKKSLSSYQLARDLDMNQKTAWKMMMAIRKEMDNNNISYLEGIIEADETYISSGKRSKTKKRNAVEAQVKIRSSE